MHEEQPGVAGVGTDERAKLTSEARSLSESLRQRDQLIAQAAHDIKTPLSTLAIQVDILLRAIDQGRGDLVSSETLEDKLLGMRRQVRRIRELVESLLDVSRVNAHHQSGPPPEPSDLGVVVTALGQQLSSQLDQCGSPLRFEAKGDLTGRWDPVRLELVVTNLLVNAIRYGRGEPIEVGLEGSASDVVLRVKDHGVGIDPKYAHLVFEPMQRQAPVARPSGVGLGMYIARTLVEEMGGQISVESRVGVGSTFTVTLPRERNGAHASGVHSRP